MKDSKKLNESCLKLFQFLKLLYEDNATYENVLEIFKTDNKEEAGDSTAIYLRVNLNKYINALKIFGIKVTKNNGKYILESSLYAMRYTLDDLRSISILTSAVRNFPDKKGLENIKNFLRAVELRMTGKDKTTLKNLTKNVNYDFSFYYSELKEQIRQCEDLCGGQYIVRLMYKKKEKEIELTCNPKELVYDSRTVFLKVYDPNKRQYFEIPINTIISISVLPGRANPVEMNTTVVFKLKNRLARTYKLKEGETGHIDNDGNYVVMHRCRGSYEKLIQRLMRYWYDCEIISPKHVRDEMINTIVTTLNNYEE